MDKYLIITKDNLTKIPSVFLYNKIDDLNETKIPRSNERKDMEIWKIMIDDWTLKEYDSRLKVVCNCDNKKELMVIGNCNNQLKICNNCIVFFPKIENTYKLIHHTIYNVIGKNDEIVIKEELINILGLDNEVVRLNNDAGTESKYFELTIEENKKIHELLNKIGKYHYKYQTYRKKINCLFKNIYEKVKLMENMTKKDNLWEKVKSIITDCKKCDQCNYLEECYECFYEESNSGMEKLTEEQRKALWKLYRWMMGGEKLMYGFYGYAGTGKTTIIKYILQIRKLKERLELKELKRLLGFKDFIKEEINENDLKKYNKTIVEILKNEKIIMLTSPTNKALDVIREKIGEVEHFIFMDNNTGYVNSLKVMFYTVAKLLSYKRYYDNNHNITFRRGYKYQNIFNDYHLIIIDECSMLSQENVKNIVDDTENNSMKGKLIFTGDRAQLPPPKEKNSKVFSLEIEKIELTKIMRTEDEMIKKISNFVRRWLFNKIKENNLRKTILSYQSPHIKFYTQEEKFIKDCCQNEEGIILVWTNETRKRYNGIMRERLFNVVRKSKYMSNERLIFNNFYRVRYKKVDYKAFYSSMPIVITRVNILDNFRCDNLELEEIMERVDIEININGDLIELRDMERYEDVKKYINQFIIKFNISFHSIYRVWELFFRYKGKNERFLIYSIYESKKYQKEIDKGKRYIKEYFDATTKIFKNVQVKETLREIVIEIFDMHYEQPFADIDYGYAMTVDKSQGSTYETVYIDAKDILDMGRYPFLDIDVAKRRFYTAITRASDKINIFI